MRKILVENPDQLKTLAYRIILNEVKKPRDHALCIALAGELGAGKTMFVQGVARHLGITQTVASPTFTLMREYVLPKSLNGFLVLYHFDWYRLHEAKDIKALGWKEIVEDPKNLVLVEWADKFPGILPKGSKTVEIRYKYKKVGREINFI